MKIEMINIEELHLNDENVNVHPQKSIEKIAKSIKRFGFRVPIIIDKNNIVIAGNGRLEAGRVLNLREIPCIRVDNLNEYELKAFAIADNRVADESFFDKTLLSSVLAELQDVNFEIDTLGFDDKEVDELLNYELKAVEDAKKDNEIKKCPNCGHILK